jgi:hypothetical protein
MLALLLISDTIVIRPFLHKHAERAEYQRTPEPKRASREVQCLVNRQGNAKLEGESQVFEKIDPRVWDGANYLLV